MTTSSDNVGLSKGLRILATLVRLAPAACDELANDSGLTLSETAAIVQLLQSEAYASKLPGTELLMPSALALQVVGRSEGRVYAPRLSAAHPRARSRATDAENWRAYRAKPWLH